MYAIRSYYENAVDSLKNTENKTIIINSESYNQYLNLRLLKFDVQR